MMLLMKLWIISLNLLRNSKQVPFCCFVISLSIKMKFVFFTKSSYQNCKIEVNELDFD